MTTAAAGPPLLCVTRSPSMRGTQIAARGDMVRFVEPDDHVRVLVKSRMSPAPRTLVTVWLDMRLDPREAQDLLMELMVEAVGGQVLPDNPRFPR